MQEPIPYRTWKSSSKQPSRCTHESLKGDAVKRAKEMVQENAVLVFGKRGCCMCHVVNRLLIVLGVNPVVCEVDEEDETGLVDELATICSDRGKDSRPEFPAVFIGGVLFGDLDRVMAAHITGELIPVLKNAGALWL